MVESVVQELRDAGEKIIRITIPKTNASGTSSSAELD
jgi:hypothetical protein